DKMARGGIYDQLGGGFHRYSVDDHWLVPHFEKMLYDNALLTRAYLHAWQLTGEPLFRAVVEETLDYILREMTSPEGGFYATQDADTEGEEGKFYVWTPQEIREVLGEEAERFMEHYDVTEEGNFEERNILTFEGSFEAREALADARRKLFAAREERAQPGRDEKVLVSWNGLMLTAFAEAARALDRDDYRRAAERNADFLLEELRTPEGRLWHVWKDGEAKVPGFLDDYTHLIQGLLALYQTAFAPRYYSAAHELVQEVLAHFDAGTGFYDTADDAENLIVRPKELQDNAVPSGNAMAVTVLLELARFGADPRYADLARASLRSVQTMLARYPLGFGQWLVALDAALARHRDVAVAGDLGDEALWALVEVARTGYRPHRVVAAGPGNVPPLLAGRETIGGEPAAYVCIGESCREPVTEPGALQALLS
ncbi:MAG: thioredoxin domain-containing protein, partial [Anaerolineales bacterium]